MIGARVVVLRDFGLLKIEELALPDALPHQAVLELLAAGIQPAQLHMVQESSRAGETEPCVPGLEGVARVLAVGSDVTRVKPGDLVLVGPAPARGSTRAPECAPIIFADGSEQAGRPIAAWATNALVDELLLTPIPADVADPERMAYFGDTVRRSVAAVTRGARVKPGQSAAVFGLGGAGLSAIVAAKALGAGVIFAIGAGAEALARAVVVGASDTADLADVGAEAQVLARCPGGVDHLIYCPDECVGQFNPSRRLVAGGGTAHLVASAGTPARQAALGDCVSTGGYDPDPPDDPETDIGSVLRWVAEGSFDPAQSIRQRYTIEQVNEAVMDLENGVDGQAILVVEALR